jgi:epoxyqueuosine reductase QueG
MDHALWIEGIIKDFVNESPENSLRNSENEKAWGEPLVGFSKGDDTLYQFYKKDIGSFYMPPFEMISQTFPRLKTTPDQITIISWILPQTEATKSDQRKRRTLTSERWARSRIYGEDFNNELRKHSVNVLLESGFEALAPLLSPLWNRETSEKYGFASNWSERHAAYASGLGTFGLCDGLITPKGKAMRCGSVIAHIQIPPTKRPYNDHHAYCLLYSKDLCGRCIQRCPAGALSEAGHDKIKCREYLHITREYVRSHYNFEGYGCGLCQTGVPCESKIPTENDLK